MGEAFIYDAVRTPRGKGKPGGVLSSLAPHALVGQLVDALRARHGAEAVARADRMILSCVGQIDAQGGHIAMVSRLAAGLPDTMAVHTLNNFCAGGLTALNTACNAVRAGDCDLVLAGGVECMSQVPFLGDRAHYYTDTALSRRLRYAPVAISADFMAVREDISRRELDDVTLRSHQRAAAAWDAGHYDSSVIALTTGQDTEPVRRDETVRPDLTLDKLAALSPAFEELGAGGYDDVIRAARPGLGPLEHRHSVANCPPIADGASLVLIGSHDAGRAHGLTPLAKIRASAETAGDPVDQLTAGFSAMDRVLSRAGVDLREMGVIEFMEAFAAVPVKFLRDYDVDPERVNVNGGHLAMGHPMGATGGMLTAALTHELVRSDAGLGLVVAHGGSGVGSAAVLERV